MPDAPNFFMQASKLQGAMSESILLCKVRENRVETGVHAFGRREIEASALVFFRLSFRKSDLDVSDFWVSA